MKVFHVKDKLGLSGVISCLSRVTSWVFHMPSCLSRESCLSRVTSWVFHLKDPTCNTTSWVFHMLKLGLSHATSCLSRESWVFHVLQVGSFKVISCLSNKLSFT